MVQWTLMTSCFTQGIGKHHLLMSGALGLAALASLSSGQSSLLQRLRRFLGWRRQHRIVGIRIFPVKSMAGLELPFAELGSHGFAHDRRFAVVDRSSGQVLTQRERARMRLITPSLIDGHLVLQDGERPENGSVRVPLMDSGEGELVKMWAKPSQEWGTCEPLCADCGNEVARWLTQALDGQEAGEELKYRLVRMAGEGGKCYEEKPKKLRKAGAEAVWADCYGEHDNLVFQDGSPMLIASLASLSELNRRLQKEGKPPVNVSRFRANLIVDGNEPFEEDWWSRMTLQGSDLGSGVALKLAKPCHRCIVTTKTQVIVGEGEHGETRPTNTSLEPLTTLKKFRLQRGGKDERFKTAPCFAVNVSFVSPPDATWRKVQIGDTLTVDSWASQSALEATY
mmetsp:Transcript_118641/g.236315  ORF Transcript_118641/g.236315 Transcript_118641/m.236315 type:complete len:396 (+) Transcript_118641:83-1270(+)